MRLACWIAVAMVACALAARPAAAQDAGVQADAAFVVATDANVPSAVPVDAGLPVDAGPPPDAAVEEAPAPVIAPEPEPEDAGPPPSATLFIIKLVGGLAALMVLAYVGSHRKVIRLQERLGIGGVIAAGFPFVALGLIARQPEVGLLTDDVLEGLAPILHFGLGWLGFIIGAQLDIRVLDKVPAGTGYLVVVESLAPFAITAGAIGASMIAIGGARWDDPTFWRDIIVLGAAAAMTAPRRFRGFANRTWREGRGVDHLLAQLDEIVGVIGLLFVASYFRPSIGWGLPGTAWVFVAIGLGVVIGVLIFVMVRVPVSNEEFLAVVLGSIAFGSGLAGFLYLSPIVVCFVAGALVTNFPCEQRDRIFLILNHLERPIHLLFLIVVGATWVPTDWRAWALVPMFVAARVLGKWTGIFAARSTVGKNLPAGYGDRRSLVTPVSALSIALVISLFALTDKFAHLVGGAPAALPLWITTIVIGGAILTEILVSITTPPKPARDPTAPPRDDLDDDDDDDEHELGPVYDEDERPPMLPRDPTLGRVKKP